MKTKEIHYCSICGVSSETKNVTRSIKFGDYLCKKHKHQFEKFGEFKDHNPRGVFDPNEIRIFSDYAEIDTYDEYGNVLNTFKLDIEDVSKLENHKWRTTLKGTKPYLITGNQYKDIIYFHRLVLPTDLQVDHISGDSTDNRKVNLREISLKDNLINQRKSNRNTSGIRGVSFSNSEKVWKVDFTYKNQRIYVKRVPTIEEAVYMRYLLEITFQKDLRNTSNDELYMEYISNLSESKKLDLEKYIEHKINSVKAGV